jgi:histidinol-phosphate phosphatase family protein
MRLALHAPGIAPGSRLELAVAGLAARGHTLRLSGRAPAGSRLPELVAAGARDAAEDPVDVVVGGPRPFGAFLLASLANAQAVVLALEAAAHARWGLLERWGWSRARAAGVIAESDAAAFIASLPEEERERVALWSGAPPGREASTHPDTSVLERACERSLARAVAGPGRAALFVDRDGTLIEERDHLSDPEGVVLLPGVARSLREARAQGHPVIVISNQAGVGRELFPETRVHEVMARLRSLLRREGVELDAVRFCPHAPETGCDCRKPGPRLLLEAAEDLRVALPDSVMVGDKWLDVEAGRAAGARGVLVRTGHGATEAAAADPARADAVLPDLPDAVGWFLERAPR